MRRFLLAGVLCLIAGAVLAQTTPDKSRMTTGEVVTADEPGMTLVIKKDDGEQMNFAVQTGALIRLHGPKGKLGQLKSGDVVTVTYTAKDGKNVATQIQHM